MRPDASSSCRIGTAGWTIPAPVSDQFGPGASHLARYATRFLGAEINSSFYKAHRRSTYERWAAASPPGFLFAVKIPRAISHDQRLVACDVLLDVFLGEIDALADHLGPLLLQLPPSFAFDSTTVGAFLYELRERYAGEVVVEPRHESWFGDPCDRLLASFGIARAGADPAVVPLARESGGWRGLAYLRLHGSPRMYYSSYPDDALGMLASTLADHRRRGVPSWCIFDNTASGAAAADALRLDALLEERPGRN